VILALSSIMAIFSGCHKEEQTPDHPRVAAGVAMQDVRFFSDALKRQATYRVFLPSQIADERKLPVVYLLHGCGSDFRDWSNYSDVSAYAAEGMILVMPDGGCSYYANAAEKPEDRYEDFLVHDLIADVEGRFPALKDRKNRAVIGVSMGGFAAVKLALSRPELFVFAGAISPAIDVAERKFSWKHASQWWRFRSIFGPMGSKERQERNPFALVKSADPRATPYLYLSAGEQEPLLDPIKRFAARLKERGFAYEIHTLPGGHDWGQWNAQIPGCFARLKERLDQDSGSGRQ
jgi:putative tributyrin esterase